LETLALRRRAPMLLLGLLLLLGIAALALLRNADEGTPVSVGTRAQVSAPAAAQPAVAMNELVLANVPPGFALGKQNEASNSPVNSAKALISRMTTGSRESGDRNPKTIYVTAQLQPAASVDLQALRADRPNPVDTTVQGKPALLSKADDISSLDWAAGPQVLIRVVARGPVSDDELRAVAEGVTLR
jgi:hypothetical protein